NIIYVGRSDSQIKLKGLRIELGEAETAAKTVDSIKNACVLFDADRQDIVLFAETDEDIKLRRLNLELKKLIPAYMAPTRLVCLKELPKTPNGKIDRVLLKKTFIEQN
ncbi:MAG: D-alanine--poly(phosphoribitol) ligase, partial [Clostridiales bacterium]|nr:D-alanine--poly(phosphoribitol) ligase [Clostridiales bacterium]